MNGVEVRQLVQGKHSRIESSDEEVGRFVHRGTRDPTVVLGEQVPLRGEMGLIN